MSDGEQSRKDFLRSIRPLRPAAKLNERRIQAMCDLVRAFHSDAVVARKIGVSPQLFCDWKKRGRDAEAWLENPDNRRLLEEGDPEASYYWEIESLYYDFWMAYDEATTEPIGISEDVVREQIVEKRDGNLAMKYLRYRSRDYTHKIEANITHTVQVAGPEYKSLAIDPNVIDAEMHLLTDEEHEEDDDYAEG